MPPHLNEKLRVNKCHHSAVAGPVGVHLIVQAEEHRLAVFFDLRAESPEIGIVFALQHPEHRS